MDTNILSGIHKVIESNARYAGYLENKAKN